MSLKGFLHRHLLGLFSTIGGIPRLYLGEPEILKRIEEGKERESVCVCLCVYVCVRERERERERLMEILSLSLSLGVMWDKGCSCEVLKT